MSIMSLNEPAPISYCLMAAYTRSLLSAPLPPVVVPLHGEGRFGAPPLGVAAFPALDHPAELVDGGEVLVGLGLETIGEGLDEVRAAQWVDGVRHSRFVGDDLLGAQGDL